MRDSKVEVFEEQGASEEKKQGAQRLISAKLFGGGQRDDEGEDLRGLLR